MAAERHLAVELRAGALSEQDLGVTRMTGREELSAPFSFEIEFQHREGETLELADLAGAEGLLTVRSTEGEERQVHGILWAVEMAGVARGKPSYRARLVPALQRLVHVRRSRVFQAMSVPDIVAKVLKEGKVEHRASLTGSYPPREFCLQYRESDLAFVSRLLEAEGIFYFFEHGPDAHTLVLADAPGGFVPIAGPARVPFRVVERGGAHQKDEHLSALERTGSLRSSTVLLQDFDFLRPALKVEGKAVESGARPALEQVEYPGGFADSGAGGKLATTRLQALRRDAAAFAGEGTVVRLLPGGAFEVADHPDASFNARLHVLTVTHQASQARAGTQAGGLGHDYRCRFEAVEASLPVRPARRTPRPQARLETAVVVGPAGEEIHTDKHGRVKVKFHWDREGKRDEKASCWLRCAQAWAGPAWGASFIPRVGQEVLIRFLEGNPDRPLVAGAVYNGQNPTPIHLPDDKTRSALRSDSSLGGGGYNELRFEDVANGEEVSLRAQKDEAIGIENDKSQLVRSNEALAVDKDRSIQVGGQQILEVAEGDAATVDGSQTLTVAGDRQVAVAAVHDEEVTGQQAITVTGNRTLTTAQATAETVGAASALTVGGAYAVSVAGLLNEIVGGLFSGQVGGARVEVVGASRQEQVGKDSSAQVGDDWVQEVHGLVAQTTGRDHQEKVDGKREVEVKEGVSFTAKSFKLEADKFSLVVDGKVVLSIDSSGNVTFGVSKLLVNGDDLKLKGSKLQKTSSDSASSASPAVTRLKPLEGEKAHVEIAVEDDAGAPVANEWFQVEFADGTVKEGRTGGAGKAWVPGPKAGDVKVTFPKADEKALKRK